MKLKGLLDGIEGLEVQGDTNAEVEGIVADSRLAGPRNIFVAMRGHRHDGHDFVTDAYERGARIFLLERPVNLPNDISTIICKSTRKTSAELLKRLYNFDQSDMLFIGITGTKGKSSVAFLLGKMLESVGVFPAVVGTLGITFLGEGETLPNTTPDLFFLIPRLAKLKARGARVIILEASSQALADERLFGLTLDIGVFTSLTPDHIGTGEHRDFSSYRSAKRRLFTEFSLSHAVVNADDFASEYMCAGVHRVTKCSLFDDGCELFPRRVAYTAEGTKFLLNGSVFCTSLVGEYNLMNILLSLAVAGKITGLPYGCFKNCLKQIEIPGRFERILHQGRLFIIDFAHNADSLERLCHTVKQLYARPIILVFGSVGERSEGRRTPLARVAEKYARLSVITADDPGEEPLFKILAELHGAFLDKSRAVTVPDRAEAIRHAYRVSRAGDVIVLAGKGHERHQRIGKQRLPFCEREIIKELK